VYQGPSYWPQVQTYSHIHHVERIFGVKENCMPLKIQVCWAMMLCSLVNNHHYLRGACYFHFQYISRPEPKDGSQLLRKVGNYLSITKMTYARRLELSSSPLWEPEILHACALLFPCYMLVSYYLPYVLKKTSHADL
jgi:hypothetical protein